MHRKKNAPMHIVCCPSLVAMSLSCSLYTQSVQIYMANVVQCSICRVLPSQVYVVKDAQKQSLFQVKVTALHTDSSCKPLGDMQVGDTVGLELGRYDIQCAIYHSCTMHHPYSPQGQNHFTCSAAKRPTRARFETVTTGAPAHLSDNQEGKCARPRFETVTK